MNFKISKNVFYNYLQLVSKAISSNSPLPALSGIKIDVEKNKIILTGSDAEISIKKELDNEKYDDLNLVVIEEGSIVIESRYLLEIVRKIDSNEISFELIDGSFIKIVGKATEYKINGMRSTEYPSIDFNKPSKSFEIDSDVLLKIINQTTFATSDKEIRPVLTGVNFNIKNNVLECVATDSYRLAKKVVDIDTDLNINVTIPAKSLNEVAKSIFSDGKITISLNDKKAQFYIDGTLVQTRLIDGSYPETVSRGIPCQSPFVRRSGALGCMVPDARRHPWDSGRSDGLPRNGGAWRRNLRGHCERNLHRLPRCRGRNGSSRPPLSPKRRKASCLL